MTTQEKKEKIKSLVEDMLNNSHEAMIKKIEQALNCGGVDIDGWDGKMILPKIIVTAILKNESEQYECKGTSFERRVKKEVKNLIYHL